VEVNRLTPLCFQGVKSVRRKDYCCSNFQAYINLCDRFRCTIHTVLIVFHGWRNNFVADIVSYHEMLCVEKSGKCTGV